jgi:hypothetical protein
VKDHSLPIRDALRSACAPLAGHEHLPAVAQMAADDVAQSAELMGAMKATGKLILALRDACDSAKAALATVEGKMLDALLESGAYSLRTEHHVISAVEPKPRPVITDRSALPSHLMRARDPEPDMAAITRAMKEGPVPGVSLSNSAPHLRVAPRNA